MKEKAMCFRREIVKYLSSVAFSSAANSASALAIYWYVLKMTGEVSMLVLAGVLQSLPSIFAVGVAALANKKGSRYLMYTSDGMRAVLFLLITLFSTVSIGVWLAIGINMILQVLEQLRTSATTTVIPEMTKGKGKLGSWVGISNTITALFELVGITFSGIIFDKFGYQVLFLIIALTFVAASFTSYLLRVNYLVSEDEPSNFNMLGAFKHIYRSKTLLGIIILAIIVNFAFAPLDVVLTALVHSVLSSGATVYGFMDGGLMAGMIAGSAIFSLVAGKWHIKPIAIVGFAGCGAVLIILAFADNTLFAIAAVIVLGSLMAFIDSSMDSWLLETVPENGRITIFTTVTALFTLATPLGTAFLGYLLNKTSVSIVLITMGVLILCAVLYATQLREDYD